MNPKVEQASHYEAADATASIRIKVTHRALVLNVSINDGWRRKLAPEQFAEALLNAYREAIQMAISAEREERSSATSRRPGNEELAKILRDYDDVGDVYADWYTGVRAKLDRIKQRRQAIKEYVATIKVDSLDREIRGPNGYLTFQLQGGIPVNMTAAVSALRSASTELIREDAMAAFRTANLSAED